MKREWDMTPYEIRKLLREVKALRKLEWDHQRRLEELMQKHVKETAAKSQRVSHMVDSYQTSIRSMGREIKRLNGEIRASRNMIAALRELIESRGLQDLQDDPNRSAEYVIKKAIEAYDAPLIQNPTAFATASDPGEPVNAQRRAEGIGLMRAENMTIRRRDEE